MSNRRDAEFTAFVAARYGHLRRLAYALSGDWHAADDLVQTSLAKLYVAWPRVRRQEAYEAYARRVLVRSAVDESRRAWRRRERPSADLPEVAHVDASAVGDDLVAVLQRLPAMQRKCVVLRHWLDMSVEETARELGVSTGTVKSHSSRGLARLREMLAENGRTR